MLFANFTRPLIGGETLIEIWNRRLSVLFICSELYLLERGDYMDEVSGYKEVDFKTHCEKCKHVDVKDWDPPCSECICEGMRLGTEVPLHYDGPKSVG